MRDENVGAKHAPHISPLPTHDKPIGVFDSGAGGLTVVKQILSLMPQERVVYFGDTARVPYGPKSPETVCRYTLQIARFLVSEGIKCLVVACNTASAVSLPTLRNEISVPIVGVIEPGARAAVAATRNEKLGVIGTFATITSGVYAKTIKEMMPQAQILSKACPLFVPLAEEGWVAGQVPELVAQTYLADFVQFGVDTLVLGCTHYPLLKETVRKVVGERVALVDSAEATSVEVKALLEDLALLKPEKGIRPGDGGLAASKFLVSDDPRRFAELGRRFLGTEILNVGRIDV